MQRPGAIYLGSLMPPRNLDAVRALAERRVTSFATDAIPRTTRAQSMDTLSSMASLAGYVEALSAGGDRASALVAARRNEELPRRELGMAPCPVPGSRVPPARSLPKIKL